MIKNFYPTPKHLIAKMVSKIQNKDARTFLDPSAGKGDIIDFLHDVYRYRTDRIDAIEIDETLQATLRGKSINVIDSDFLTFSGADKFDVILMNPPFDTGDKHLLKAIDIMYCGEIVCLLNAETLRNLYTNRRKLLVKELDRLNANIEYINGAFLDAERKTAVDIALVYIRVENQVEDDLFAGVDNTTFDAQKKITTDNEIQTQNKIQNMVDDFNRVIKVGTETLVNYYKNYNHISKYIKLANQDGKADSNYTVADETLTNIMQKKLNQFLRDVRKSYWTDVLDLKDVKSRLTSKKSDLFHHQLQKHAYMDFTEHNIRQFIINLIGGYEQTLIDAVVKLFDDFTIEYAWDKDLHNNNVHYFNGWKTNKAFFINQKVILPWYRCWDTLFKKWQIDYKDAQKLHDIDLVMSYFDAKNDYYSITDSLKYAFELGQNKKILSTYFEISVFKKGTIHLIFRDEDVLRRFNIVACKGKNWLPQDYGHKSFEQLSYEEQEIVKSFEDKKTYNEKVGDYTFQIKASCCKLLN
jgi:predicted RNA methylase